MIKNGNGNGNGFRSVAERKSKFRELYPQYGSIGQTLKAMKIRSRQSFYKWCKGDPAFKKYYEDELKPNRIDELVTIAFVIATAGRLKTTKTMGLVIDATKPQTDMIKYLLGCFDPDNYSEKRLLELQGKGENGEVIFKVIREHRREVESSET